MQNQWLQQNRKWLGVGLIVAAILIALIGITGTSPGLHHYMPYGNYGYSAPGYGHHMMGYPSMSRGLTGRHFMHGWGSMMQGAVIPPWFDDVNAVDLSDDQKLRISTMHEKVRDQRWDLLDHINQQQRKLAALLDVDDPDPALVGAQFARAADLRRQLLELDLDERRRIDNILTGEQRDQLRKYRRAWMMNGDLF